jgi:hypothetical protein
MTQQTNAAPAAAAQVKQAPFRKGTQPTLLATGYTQTLTMTTAAQQLPTWQLPTSNILRNVFLEVKGTTAGNSATVASWTTPELQLLVPLTPTPFQSS